MQEQLPWASAADLSASDALRSAPRLVSSEVGGVDVPGKALGCVSGCIEAEPLGQGELPAQLWCHPAGARVEFGHRAGVGSLGVAASELGRVWSGACARGVMWVFIWRGEARGRQSARWVIIRCVCCSDVAAVRRFSSTHGQWFVCLTFLCFERIQPRPA